MFDIALFHVCVENIQKPKQLKKKPTQQPRKTNFSLKLLNYDTIVNALLPSPLALVFSSLDNLSSLM